MTLDLFPETANPDANLLPYDGIVSDFGRIFTAAEADRYFEILQRDIPWRHDEAVIYGKHIITAREVAWYGDTSYNYGYSGANRIALPWSGVLPELKNRVEAAIAGICPTRFNSCLLNRYNNGNEGMAWHSDEGQGLAEDSAIASLSLGAARKFAFKHKESKEKREMWLEHGQLILMHGETQKHWLHTILKSTRIQEPRINLTFRVMTG